MSLHAVADLRHAVPICRVSASPIGRHRDCWMYSAASSNWTVSAMRTVVISTDVFAALWGRRQPNEDSENAILERLLGLPAGPPIDAQSLNFNDRARARNAGADGQGGIYNHMFDVHFPAGFEIFRNYKGREYRAVVRDNRWVMDGRNFPSLFSLSMAIIDSRENPWMHWKYRNAKGHADFISNLRRIPSELEKASRRSKKKHPSTVAKKSPRKTPRAN
jgi:hypothetical protein